MPCLTYFEKNKYPDDGLENRRKEIKILSHR